MLLNCRKKEEEKDDGEESHLLITTLTAPSSNFNQRDAYRFPSSSCLLPVDDAGYDWPDVELLYAICMLSSIIATQRLA